MLITNRKYPILEKLKSGNIESILASFKPIEAQDDRDFIAKAWELYSKDFAEEISILSKPFCENFERVRPSLQKNAGPILIGDIENCNGTIIINDIAFCYQCFKGEKDGVLLKGITVFVFLREALRSVLIMTAKNNEDYQGLVLPHEGEHKYDFAMNILKEVLFINMFKKYAKVETKYLPANKKVKDFNCKYVNQTNSNVTILNSTWFTNLVKSDAFKVRGHFRLQPKKVNGEWTKELIWINEFQKEGYTAPARKLKEFPESQTN